VPYDEKRHVNVAAHPQTASFGIIERVLLLQIVFSYYRLSSLTTEGVLLP